MGAEMTFRDIATSDYELRKELKRKRESEILELLKRELSESEFVFSSVSIAFENKDREAGLVKYEFTLPDGFSQQDSCFWAWDVSVEDIVERIVKNVSYIEKLREEYPEFAKANDLIQAKRKYDRTVNLSHFGYIHQAKLSADLCDYMKLPNLTSCSFGGGDYEIKRTPKRVSDFNQNIDILCNFLVDCIAELRTMKIKEDTP